MCSIFEYRVCVSQTQSKNSILKLNSSVRPRQQQDVEGRVRDFREGEDEFVGWQAYSLFGVERERNGHFEQVLVPDGETNDLLVEYGQEGLY